MAILNEGVKTVGAQKRRANQMGCKITIEPLAINRWCYLVAIFQFGEVLRWRNTANDPVGAVGKGCLVDNGVKDIRLEAMLFAPLLREDVMDIDILAKKNGVVEFLA